MSTVDVLWVIALTFTHVVVVIYYGSVETMVDNMKKPAAILVLQYWYTILVIPVFYQYLPVSAILNHGQVHPKPKYE
jgi:hypothetical protein